MIIDVNGFQLHYEERGHGEPLLLLHGGTGIGGDWNLVFTGGDPAGHRVIVPDLRGNGYSRRYKKQADYKMAKYAEDIDALLRHLHVESCVVVGYSLGALIALTFERLHKKKVESIVLIASIYKLHRLWRVRVTSPLLYLAAALASLLPVPQKKMRVDYTKFQGLGDENPRRTYHDIYATGLRVYFYALKQIYAFDHDIWWKELSAPALILYGKHDTTMPEKHVLELAKDIPHAKIIEYKEGSHMLVYNNIPEVASAIEQCVDQQAETHSDSRQNVGMTTV